MLTDDLHRYSNCLQCGYSLRGLSRDGDCPECGHSIAQSNAGNAPGDTLRRKRLHGFLAVSTVVLTAMTFWLVQDNASAEPYMQLRSYDLYTQLVLGAIVWVAWLALGLATLVLMIKSLIHRGWLLALVWMIGGFLLQWVAIIAYIDDITHNL